MVLLAKINVHSCEMYTEVQHQQIVSLVEKVSKVDENFIMGPSVRLYSLTRDPLGHINSGFTFNLFDQEYIVVIQIMRDTFFDIFLTPRGAPSPLR